MKKKVLFICFLILLISIAYKYLSLISNGIYTYKYVNNRKPVIILKNEIEIYDIDSFTFDYYFDVISYIDYSYKYEFNDSNIIITISNNNGSYDYVFPYKLKEKEVIEVVKEVYIEKEIPIYSENNSTTDNNIYFEGYHDIFCRVGTDISDIVYELTKDIVTNCQVSIDYSINVSACTYCFQISPLFFLINNLSIFLCSRII